MNSSPKLKRLLFMAMMTAFGVVISPILRVEGMCPMAHFINVVCAVILGPTEAVLTAFLIGIIRMLAMGIPPLALTGAVFGAFFSGIFYRISKGKLLYAVLGEVFGTGIIGAIVSYPVMTYICGRQGLSWLFYVPSFICGTLIGGSIAFAFLKKLSQNGLMEKFQRQLGSESYAAAADTLGSSISVAAMGVIGYTLVEILTGMLDLKAAIFTYIAKGTLVVFIILAVMHFVTNKIKAGKNNHAKRNN